MIRWITGNSGAGKTTLGQAWVDWINDSGGSAILLDGDQMRDVWPHRLGLGRGDRVAHNVALAKLARQLDAAGHDVIVASICPYQTLRIQVHMICRCRFIYLSGGVPASEEYPYEPPTGSAEVWSLGYILQFFGR